MIPRATPLLWLLAGACSGSGLSGFGAVDGGVLLTCGSGSPWSQVALVWSDARCQTDDSTTTDEPFPDVSGGDAPTDACDRVAPWCAEDDQKRAQPSFWNDVLLLRYAASGDDRAYGQRTYCHGPELEDEGGYVSLFGPAEQSGSDPVEITLDLENSTDNFEEDSRHRPIRGTVSLASCGSTGFGVDTGLDTDR